MATRGLQGRRSRTCAKLHRARAWRASRAADSHSLARCQSWSRAKAYSAEKALSSGRNSKNWNVACPRIFSIWWPYTRGR
eukprot:9855257-Lingulodinium_polyedra.AAC.1